MSTPRTTFQSLLPTLKHALHAFQSSTSKFNVVHSLSHASSPPQTLFILDSSFNPPHKAHFTLATSALHPTVLSQYPSPHRLLLLLSTANADKAPGPAPFETRLTLMALFAEDLLAVRPDIHLDIGLTTEPFYTAKSAAIAADSAYMGARHVHLMGFDTVTRLFAPKYYPEFDPPLTALEPYFGAGHGLRVTLRPEDGDGDGKGVDQQKQFFERLARGDMLSSGGRGEWARQIRVVEAGKGPGEGDSSTLVRGAAVSSTSVREAARKGDWEEVGMLTTEKVAAAVREEGIYEA